MKLFFLVILQLLAPSALAFNYTDGVLIASVGASILSMPGTEKKLVATATHAASFGINYGLKKAFGSYCPKFAERPDGSDCLGFPSGHNQSTWTGAGIICREHGGLPCVGGVALGVTQFFGRVERGRHTYKQAAWGAGIGLGVGYCGITVSGNF